MSKEKITLDKIREILSVPFQTYEKFEEDPLNDKLANEWSESVQETSAQDFIKIFRLIQINDLIL